MLFGRLLQTALLSAAALQQTAALVAAGKPGVMFKRQQLYQNIVTWDEHSLFVRGERVMFYSGEFHPFRLPVPGLWLDVFQKIKALGYNAVSFYVDWALVEGKQGDFEAQGVFDLAPFFDAASTAGIYLLARPGPYINAEVSGGGFPGWLQRNPARLRTRDPGFEDATNYYVSRVSSIIAQAQITNGGPVILLQPENEYSQAAKNDPEFPDPVYFGFVEQQFRSNGIVVPLISNDAYPHGFFADGPPRQPSAVDIYGHDGYPLGFDCANPYLWPDNALPRYFGFLHQNQSSSTPYSIVEFQGGSFDPWGGLGFAQCTELLSPQFERVFYKNDFSFGVTIFNIYMTYGGTNWGNLGHPGGYTSYDYGAVITEDRLVTREKYSEAKLEANFLQASPAYLTAVTENKNNGSTLNASYTGDPALAVTGVLGGNNITNFFVVRHSVYNTNISTEYSITLPTSKGNITLPQLGGKLTLNGRDSKIHVTDYDLGGVNLLYSTAEIFTWKKYGDKRILVVYGGPGEEHELAISNGGHARNIEGSGAQFSQKQGATVINYQTSPTRQIVALDCSVYVYLLDRNSAYDYWVVSLPNDPVSGNYTNATHFDSAAIVRFGYLLRTVETANNCIYLTGDLNDTTTIEVIGGAPAKTEEIYFNGQSLSFQQDSYGVASAKATYKNVTYSIPDLSSVGWKKIDSLPEIQPGYDDSLWTQATLTYSNNTARNLTTPTSLYASDYGYNTGNLIYRGYFTANGGVNESNIYLVTQGGYAFGHSIWLNNTFVASFYGADKYRVWNQTYSLPKLTAGARYVLTILVDDMGNDENGEAGSSQMKNPRGVLDYNLTGHAKSDITWKLTGNLHGEDYEDRTRGPLNEGGLHAERQGYHLPGAPISKWTSSALGPMEGLPGAGVEFYATTFDLDMPAGYDIPIAFSFANNTQGATPNGYGGNWTTNVPSYRCQIYVNGYQFGKYVHNIGPQDVFPVPEGIWNYHGSNYVAVSLWSLEQNGAKVESLSLVAGPNIQTAYGPVKLSPMTGWAARAGAY